MTESQAEEWLSKLGQCDVPVADAIAGVVAEFAHDDKDMRTARLKHARVVY